MSDVPPTATVHHPFPEDYSIFDSIGHGSFATVYQAAHRKTSKMVAIKTILCKKLSPKLVKGIEDEIKFLQEMKHPNITELYDIKRNEHKVCLIMELCYIDLSDYIKANKLKPGTGGPGGGLSEVIFRHFLLQLVSAFKFLREKQLVHRDLKPQNILLSHSKNETITGASDFENYTQTLPQLKVADFGFAKILPAQSLTETACGSPLYMAPEVLKRNKYSASADLWSIGAVLYEMATGKAPFKASDIKELQSKINQGGDHIWFPGEPANIPNNPQIPLFQELNFPLDDNLISRDIKDLIRGLLIRDPDLRLTFDEFFSHTAIRRFEAPPRPVLPKSKTNLQQFAIHNSQSKSNGDALFSGATGNDPTRPTDATFTEERHRLKKSPSLNRLSGQSRQEETTLRRASHHARSSSAHQPSISEPQPSKVDDDEEADYILIESEFDNLKLRKEASNRSKIPHNTYPTPESSQRAKSSHRDPGFDVLPTPKSLPRSLLGEAPPPEPTPHEKSSPPKFRPRTDSTSDNPPAGEGSWRVGSGAALALASAISKATTKLFGARGLSPPDEQYRTDTADPIAFPLDGPSASELEEGVLREMERVACQAYALAKFADRKFEHMKSRGNLFEPDVELSPKERDSLSATCQEAFLLYAKSLGLLYLGFDQAASYWTKVSHSNQAVVVSPRLSKAARWLQDKTNECLEKAELVQRQMASKGLVIESYDTDILIYNYALNSCQDGVFKEIKGERILESEIDYLMGLWMLQAIMFRAPQDTPLNDSDMENIRQMMNMVEDRLANFRKTLDDLDLRQYAFGHSYFPYDGSRPNRT